MECGLSLRKEHGLKLFDKEVQRRMFGQNRSEVTGGRRRVLADNEKHYNMDYSPDDGMGISYSMNTIMILVSHKGRESA
jgi:hypothetical protein